MKNRNIENHKTYLNEVQSVSRHFSTNMTRNACTHLFVLSKLENTKIVYKLVESVAYIFREAIYIITINLCNVNNTEVRLKCNHLIIYAKHSFPHKSFENQSYNYKNNKY